MTEEEKLQESKSKFAKPDSLVFRAKYAQQKRKDRKKKNELSGLSPNERP
jgi:hypothetical protein